MLKYVLLGALSASYERARPFCKIVALGLAAADARSNVAVVISDSAAEPSTATLPLEGERS